MFNKNLLKRGWNTINEEQVKVIDSNALVEKRIKEAAEMQTHNLEQIPVDMVDGIDAFTVASLIGDEENVQESATENPDETEDAGVGEEYGDGLEPLLFPKEEAGGEADDEKGFRPSIIKAVAPSNVIRMDEQEKEMQKKLQAAKEEADRILAEAEEKAEKIRWAAHEEGKKAGYNDGYADGLAQMVEKEHALKQKEAQIEAEYQKKIDELEPQFVAALTEIYEHIFKVDLKEHREIIVHLISDTIRKTEGSKDFIIHVSKEDYPYVSMQKKILQSAANVPNATIEIVEDLTLEQSACMIETGGGIFDCGLGTELKELTAKLKLLSYEKKEQK